MGDTANTEDELKISGHDVAAQQAIAKVLISAVARSARNLDGMKTAKNKQAEQEQRKILLDKAKEEAKLATKAARESSKSLNEGRPNAWFTCNLGECGCHAVTTISGTTFSNAGLGDTEPYAVLNVAWDSLEAARGMKDLKDMFTHTWRVSDVNLNPLKSGRGKYLIADTEIKAAVRKITEAYSPVDCLCLPELCTPISAEGLKSDHLWRYRKDMEHFGPEYHAAASVRIMSEGRRVLVLMKFSSLVEYMTNVPGAMMSSGGRPSASATPPITLSTAVGFLKTATETRIKHMASKIRVFFRTCAPGDLTYVPAGWCVVEKALAPCSGYCSTFINASSELDVSAFLDIGVNSNMSAAQLLELRSMIAVMQETLETHQRNGTAPAIQPLQFTGAQEKQNNEAARVQQEKNEAEAQQTNGEEVRSQGEKDEADKAEVEAQQKKADRQRRQEVRVAEAEQKKGEAARSQGENDEAAKAEVEAQQKKDEEARAQREKDEAAAQQIAGAQQEKDEAEAQARAQQEKEEAAKAEVEAEAQSRAPREKEEAAKAEVEAQQKKAEAEAQQKKGEAARSQGENDEAAKAEVEAQQKKEEEARAQREEEAAKAEAEAQKKKDEQVRAEQEKAEAEAQQNQDEAMRSQGEKDEADKAAEP
jgi:DNA segregation ATPase FtsK/SpoIIIE-like protein